MRFAKRFKHRAYVALPSLLAVSALFLSLESSESRAQPVDGTQTLVFLRHAEKPDGGLGQLNCQGLNRAARAYTGACFPRRSPCPNRFVSRSASSNSPAALAPRPKDTSRAAVSAWMAKSWIARNGRSQANVSKSIATPLPHLCSQHPFIGELAAQRGIGPRFGGAGARVVHGAEGHHQGQEGSRRKRHERAPYSSDPGLPR